LREIFDESAFERYCEREGVEPDREAYRNFLRDAATSSGSKARCC
jgi:hypothetical protein